MDGLISLIRNKYNKEKDKKIKQDTGQRKQLTEMENTQKKSLNLVYKETAN